MEIPKHDTTRRSDGDILEVIRVAAEKYNKMGAVPILPLTEEEFERLHFLLKTAVGEDS